MASTTFIINDPVGKVGDPDYIRIHPAKNSINVDITTFEFEENNQLVLYIPSLEISGYGNNYSEAKEMLDEAVKYFLQNLIKLPKERINLELSKLGFIRKKYKTKEYSKAYIDKDGALKGFDIAKDKVIERKFDFAI